MTVFFICITLIGSGLLLLAIILVLAEKSRLREYSNDMKDKKEDLVNAIEDAEELITEMSSFADYLVAQLDEKKKQLNQTVEEADRRIELLNIQDTLKESVTRYNEEAIDENLAELESELDQEDIPRKAKVLAFDSKRREIIKLANNGLDSTEIARLLNCGKGEIELIAKIGR